MKVLYDYQIFRTQKYGGISRYFCLLMKYLAVEKIRTPVLFSVNSYLKEEFGYRQHEIRNPLVFKGLNYLNRAYTLLSIRFFRPDVVHPTFYNTYILAAKRTSHIVITIHDMINEKLPAYFVHDEGFVRKKKRHIEEADHIIAISQNTKKDLIELYQVDPARITVVYHSLPEHMLPGRTPAKRPVAEHYLLFVGVRRGYKNFTGFVRGVAPLLREDRTLRVFCAGGKRFSREENKLFETLGITKQFKQALISDDELIAAYTYAEAFVYPSLYEGFGIPILEAFACQCPIAISGSSCFPEIAGDAAVYFDPLVTESITAAIRAVLTDREKRTALVKTGLDRLSLFTYQKTCEETLAVYEKVLADKGPAPH